MSLDLLDDVFLLDFPLEAAQGILERFSFLKPYFRQTYKHPRFRVRLCEHTCVRLLGLLPILLTQVKTNLTR